MTWQQILTFMTPYTLIVLGFLSAIYKRTSNTNQHFDPKSPVGQTAGTIPNRLKAIEEHIKDVTIWKPEVTRHQSEQDRRLKALDGEEHHAG